MVTELNEANFQRTLQAAKVPVLVDFSASWCQPCKALAPTIDKVAGDYKGKMDVYKVDIDNAQEVWRVGIPGAPSSPAGPGPGGAANPMGAAPGAPADAAAVPGGAPAAAPSP